MRFKSRDIVLVCFVVSLLLITSFILLSYVVLEPTTRIHEHQKLIARDGAEGDYFGGSVAINGDRIVVGSHLDDDSGFASGSAYLFERHDDQGWLEEAKIIASDGAEKDRFGSSIDIGGELIVVSSPTDDDNGGDSGSAYVYQLSGSGAWIERAKLTASDGAAYEQFGNSVAIDGDRIVVGSWQDADNGRDSGSAYVYERSGSGVWTVRAKLTASDGAVGNRFGSSIAIAGDRVVVGSDYDDDIGESSGSSYVFRWSDVEI